MDAEMKAQLLRKIGELSSQGLRLLFSRSSTVAVSSCETQETPTPVPTESTRSPKPNVHSAPQISVEMPSTEETIIALKDRLASELYRVEQDLQGGARIFGKPCDCLTRQKHGGAITAIAGELMSYRTDRVYQDVIDWYSSNEAAFQPAAIIANSPDYYRAMMPKVRQLRKQIVGTETTPLVSVSLSLEDAKRLAAEEAVREVEKQWKLAETK